MNYSQKDGKTYFTLCAGTVFQFGSEVLTVESPLEVSVEKLLSETAVEETIQGTGGKNFALNKAFFNTDKEAEKSQTETTVPKVKGTKAKPK